MCGRSIVTRDARERWSGRGLLGRLSGRPSGSLRAFPTENQNRAQKCNGCPDTRCNACHDTKQLQPRREDRQENGALAPEAVLSRAAETRAQAHKILNK